MAAGKELQLVAVGSVSAAALRELPGVASSASATRFATALLAGKVGLSPVQREGVDYEPDLFFDMTVPNNDLIVSKSRCDRLVPGEVFKKPGNDLADVIIEWIQDAEPASGARSLGEAISIAVMEGIAAAEQKSIQYRRSLYITRDLAAGDVLSADNLRAIRPGHGLPTKYLEQFLGRRVRVAVKRGTPVSWDLL